MVDCKIYLGETMDFLAAMPPEIAFYGKFALILLFIVGLCVVSFFAMFG